MEPLWMMHGMETYRLETDHRGRASPSSKKFQSHASPRLLRGSFSEGGLAVKLARMEDSESDFPISIIQWKSYRLKRNTVNTLSAECQALVAGIGEIHWQRFLLLEVLGYRPDLHDWQDLMQKIPFTAVTDSKSLYDTITTTSNASIPTSRTSGQRST